MNLLKRENWWIWLLTFLMGSTISSIILGAMLDVFERNAWYTKWYYWVIGLIFVIPFIIMIYVFFIIVITKVAAKLNVDGKDYYLSPYLWIILIIIPLIGWLALIVMYFYLFVSILISLHNGEGEKYIK